MRTRHFTDLIVWQRSMKLAKEVYLATNAFPKEETFGLRSQLRRAAVSMPSNIAEGHGRLSDKLFRVFLAQARGFLNEVQTQLLLSRDLGFLREDGVDVLLNECSAVTRMVKYGETGPDSGCYKEACSTCGSFL